MRKNIFLGFLFCFATFLYGQQSKGYQFRPYEVPVGESAKQNAVLINNVPTYLWHRGCGPTALGMIIGYYDGHGFSDLFSDTVISQTYNINMEIASDEHYSDYSEPKDYYPNIIQDNSEIGIPHQHNSIADFMNTSFSSCGNYWGWSWLSDIGSAFEDYVYYKNPNYITSFENNFYSSTSWDEYMLEIDNNNPVILLVDTDGDNQTDHFVTGIGYNSVTQQYAVYDTWDNDIHWYEWKGMDNSVFFGIFAFTKFSIINNNPNIVLENPMNKKLIDIINIMGNSTKTINNSLLFYIYNDGSVEKKIVLE